MSGNLAVQLLPLSAVARCRSAAKLATAALRGFVQSLFGFQPCSGCLWPLARALTELPGAQRSDFTGQDSSFAYIFSLGPPEEPSNAPVTRSIEADFITHLNSATANDETGRGVGSLTGNGILLQTG